MNTPVFHAGCGVPGAGKTFYLRGLCAANPDWVYICPDHLRGEVNKGDQSNQSKDGFIFKTLIPCRIVGAWALRKTVAYDATLVHRKARKQILEFAKEQGYRTVLHVLRTPFEVSRVRNATRTRVVPDFVMTRMEQNWQEPDIATEPYIDEIINVPLPVYP